MGTFDTVRCDFPLPIFNRDWKYLTKPEDYENLRKEVFQTKDLDNTLSHYFITGSGVLLEMIDGTLKETGFTGEMNFYTDYQDNWYEYQAKFSLGRMKSIKRKISKWDKIHVNGKQPTKGKGQ